MIAFRGSRDPSPARALKDVRDLTDDIRQELEKFFKAADELEDNKPGIIGCEILGCGRNHQGYRKAL